MPIEKRYVLFMTGQMIASLGGPLVYNLAAKVKRNPHSVLDSKEGPF
jgi:hypothetical protein